MKKQEKNDCSETIKTLGEFTINNPEKHLKEVLGVEGVVNVHMSSRVSFVVEADPRYDPLDVFKEVFNLLEKRSIPHKYLRPPFHIFHRSNIELTIHCNAIS